MSQQNWLSLYRLLAVMHFASCALYAQSSPVESVRQVNPSISINEVDSLNAATDTCHNLVQTSKDAIRKEQFVAGIVSAKQSEIVCPDAVEPPLLLADLQMLSHQFDAAEETLHKLLLKYPRNLGALIMSGQVQYLKNQDRAARLSFQEAVKAAPDRPEPHYWLGRLSYQDQHLQQAIGEFEIAAQIDPGYYKAYDGLGLCYEALGKPGQASEQYLRAITLVQKDHQDYDVVYADFAELLLKMGRSHQAFNLAFEAASRNPRKSRNYFIAGKALQQEGDADASLRWLTKAVQMDPHYPDPHYLLARIYHKQGKSADADAEIAIFKSLSASAPQQRR
jgi:tetratricopeptide (TPR) repeat protein